MRKRYQGYKTALISILLIIGLSESTVYSQTTYYVDYTDGDDTWTGISPSSPIKTLEQVNILALNPGDSVLFKRGDQWRYQLIPQSGNTTGHIYYGAYGIGEFPTISVSLNMNNISDWTLEANNIWSCNQIFSENVGNIIFDNNDHAGIMKWKIDSLLQQDDFYFNFNTNKLFIFSTSNPADLHTQIECALKYHIVDQTGKSYITYENIALRYGAAHGIGGGNTSNIIVKHCEISWIGGGVLNLSEKIRYGNGIEFWSNANNHLVVNNKIWEIYDTGVTNQCNTQSTQENIFYRNNVIWNCGLAALEIWNRPSTSITNNIVFENNTCYNMGQGWGSQRPDKLGVFYAEFSDVAQVDSIFIRNNIFAYPLRFFYLFENTQRFYNKTIDNNCYANYSSSDTLFANYSTQEVMLMEDFSAYQKASNNDMNSIIGMPNFISALNHDFHLSNNSPCIDAGIDVELNYDHDGVTRPQYLGIDIGAYEFFGLPLLIKNKHTENITIYPNPSKGEINIIFSKENNLPYEIIIYDAFGKIVYSCKTERYFINTNLLETGIYILCVLDKGKRIFQTSIIRM